MQWQQQDVDVLLVFESTQVLLKFVDSVDLCKLHVVVEKGFRDDVQDALPRGEHKRLGSRVGHLDFL